ncbi:hypothetical protein JQX13_28865 [Archangium violaceum]|uniref:hypothetical protein n=1 Tax=Archangium violaceum TaxID=83451 RepID=UPI00193C6FBC|nr:hypothetical protein [Archangium violaceum]QRK04275.1 hypothetical protein JQX13_28865 [Archangium violaceum]
MGRPSVFYGNTTLHPHTLGRLVIATPYDSYKRLVKDTETLCLRHRRGHDLRRTMLA